MKLTSSILLVLVGMAAGMAFVISCSDDAPGKADAAVCECPAGEPPLAGRFITVEAVKLFAANEVNAVEIVCPTGSQLISGSCTQAATGPQSAPNNFLLESGFYPNNKNVWFCSFQNSAVQERSFRGIAICLKPTP